MMVTKYLYNKALFPIMCLILACFVFGCSEKVVNDTDIDIKVKINAALGGISEPEALVQFILTVTGPGITEPIIAELVVIAQTIIGTVIVPAGENRVFTLGAYDEMGDLIYRGVTIANVEPNINLDIEIMMYPQVPMVRLMPTFMGVPDGFDYIIDVKAYNIANLSAITFEIISEIQLSVGVINYEVGESIAKDAVIFQQDVNIGFRVNARNSGVALSDDTGYVHLATLVLRTYSGDIMFNTTILGITPIYIVDINQDTIPVSGILTTGSSINHFSLTFAEVAHWGMADYNLSDTIYDNSSNLLHGTAYYVFLGETWFGYPRGFNGINSYVEVNDVNPLNNLDEITIGMWLQIESLTGIQTLISKRMPDSVINFQIDISPGTLNQNVNLDFVVTNTDTRFRAEALINDSSWHYIAVSYNYNDPNSAYWMVDGLIVAGQWPDGIVFPPLPEANMYPLQIGRTLSGTDSQWYSGYMYDVRIFDVALEPQFLVQIYPYYNVGQ